MKNNSKLKGKIIVSQSAKLKPTTQKSNAGNVGRPTLLANCGNIKVKIKRK